ncbi:MAG: DUF1540 domain-containing protein [Actinomycetaceae bacterium]|nr:DUF1540 domain-containing protein [Actinomycetaceae bacterium]
MTQTTIDCTSTTCAYNNHGCTALAVTIGGNTKEATCSTFIALDMRGGLPTADGHVGACQRIDCKHNNELMCEAPEIIITGNTAHCTSYEAR